MIWFGLLMVLSLLDFSQSKFTLVGKVIFKENELPDSFPDNSWLTVKVEDTSLMDAPSVSLGHILVPIRNYTRAHGGIKFKLDNIEFVRAPQISVSPIRMMR